MLKNDVVVSIIGTTRSLIEGELGEPDQDDVIETISPGRSMVREGKTYILFDEYHESDQTQEECIKCMLHVGERQIELRKKGVGNDTHMIFEEGQFHMANYQTPFGSIMIGIHTKSIQSEKTDGGLHLEIRYSLEMDCNIISDNYVKIAIENLN